MENQREDSPVSQQPSQQSLQIEHYEERAEMFLGMMAKISPDNSIAEKITAEHLDKQLDNIRVETEKHYEAEQERIRERKQARIVYALLGGGAIISVVVLLIAYKDNPDAISGIVEKLAIAAVSAFGGYGFGKYRQSKDDD